MTKERQAARKNQGLKPKSTLKTIFKIIGLGLLILVIVVAGALVWLRTPSGTAFVFEQVKTAIATKGLTLTTSHLEGPLPGRLLIKEAVLADNQGPLVKVKGLEVELKLMPLLRGVVHIPLVKIDRPELVRIPVISSQKTEDDFEPFSLPVDIRLNQLALNDGKILAGAFTSLGLETPELDMTASVQAFIEKNQTTIDFSTLLSESGTQDLFQAVIKLGASDTTADQLDISIKINDRPQGLLGALLKDPHYPGLTLDLQGRGPLNQWLGNLQLNYGDSEIDADLSFKSASGNFTQNILKNPDWQGALTARLIPGSLFPPQVLEFTGPAVHLDLIGEISQSQITGKLEFIGKGQNAIKLTAKTAGHWDSPAGQLRVEALLKGLMPENGINSEESLSLTAQVDIQPEDIEIKDLVIKGTGLSLTGAARHQINPMDIQARINFASLQNSPWVTWGLLLAGLEADYFQGDLSLGSNLHWQGPTRPATGKLELSGQNIKWAEPTLNHLLGSQVSLRAGLSGGGPEQALKIQIREFQAEKIQLHGQASYQPAEISGESKIEAKLEASLASLTALNQNLEGQLNLTVETRGQLNDFSSELEVTSPQITTATGIIKSLTFQATTSGAIVEKPDLRGQWTLKAESSSGDPLTLATNWSLKPDPTGLVATLSDLTGQLAGVKLKGNLTARNIGKTPPASATLPLSSPRLSLEGSLNFNIFEWHGLADLTGLPLSGAPASLVVTADSSAGIQMAEAILELPEFQVGLEGNTTLALQNTKLNFKAQDLFGQPDLNLKLNFGSGLSGSMTWNEGHFQALGKKGTGKFEATLNQIKITGLEGNRQDGLQLSGTYHLDDGTEIDLENLSLKLADSGLKLQNPVKISLGEQFKITPVALDFLPQGRMTAEADFTSGQIKLKAELQELAYSFFKPFVGPKLPEGQIQSMVVNLSQNQQGLLGDFNLTTRATPKNMANIHPELKLVGHLNGGSSPKLTVTGEFSGGSNWPATGTISGSLPLTAPKSKGGWPTVAPKAPLKARLDFIGPVAPLWRLSGETDRSLTGMAQVDLEVGGTMDDPDPSGTLYLAKGRYEDDVLGIFISDINLEAHSTTEHFLRAILSAKDDRGGGLALEASIKDLSTLNVEAKGRFSQFSPMYRDDLSIFFSGDIGAKGSLDQLTITSDLTIEQGEVDLKIIQASSSIPTLKISESDGSETKPDFNPHLELKIKIPGQLFIRGYGLDSEWKGSLEVEGTATQPSVLGSLEPVQGFFEFYGKEFEFTNGGLYFSGGTLPNFNLELTNQSTDITAMIRIGGNARKPTLTLDSRPPLPQDEIISQVLFGKKTSSISRFEALQLAGAIKNLTNIGNEGSFNLFGLVRKGLGLDVLRLGGGDTSLERQPADLGGSMGQELANVESKGSSTDDDALSVEAGKYLSDNIYVAVEHSDVGGAAVRFDVELTPSISLEARTSSKSSQVGLGWKKDY